MARRSFVHFLLPVLGLLVMAVPRASAEPIQWSYSGSVATTGPSSVFGSHFLASGTTQVQFADVTGTGMGSTSVDAFRMRFLPYFSFEIGSGGFYHQNVHTFDLMVGLTDTASGKSGSLTFHGGVDGFISLVNWQGGPNGTSFTQLKLNFTSPTSQGVVLGGHLYKVSIDPVTDGAFVSFPPPPGRDPTASSYVGVPMHVQVSDVPEPSTLALAAAGLVGLSLRAWRRRRARREPQPAA